MNMKNDDDAILDFSRFLKKIHEVETAKQRIPQKEDPNALTPAQEYVRRYGEKWYNRIYIGGKKNG